MHKAFLLIFGLLIAACSKSMTSTSTATIAPSPIPAPTLIREIELETQSGTAYTLDWSTDGESLAVASGGEITLLSSDISEIQSTLKPEGGALGVTWSPDETQFATVNGFRNQTVTLWDWDRAHNQLRHAQKIQAGSDQYGVSWSPDGRRLATLAEDSRSTIQIWDTSTWDEIQKFELPYTNPRRALHWSADGVTLYGAGESRNQLVVFALNVSNGNVQEVGKFSLTVAEVFAVSPDSKMLALADARGVVQIIDVTSGETLTGIKSVDQPVDLAWNPNRPTLAILDYKTKLQLWEVVR
jgi:WD40 repeat protein